VFRLEAKGDQEIQAGQGGSACAGGHQSRLANLLADQPEAIKDSGADHDSGAMLVIMKDRDLQAFLEGLFDDEAFRGLDVLQIDAAEGGFETSDGLDELLGVAFIDLDVENVDVGKLLEEDGLAFHHRLGGEGADGPQAEHRGAVGDDGHQIAAAGIEGRRQGIGDDLLAGRRHPRRVGQGQVALIGQWLGRLDRQLARTRITVIIQRALSQFFRHLNFPKSTGEGRGRQLGDTLARACP
jgi:hypothetical protein